MENITKVYLLRVPLENDYNHTLYFGSKSDQQTYFQSKVTANGTFNDFSYQRKDNFIRVEKQFDEVIQYNYVMYQNAAYSNKWFYAFITDVKYINDGRTDIYIETDVIQTWMFDITIKPSFIEREHVNDDTIGTHTVPEGLETGEYVINSFYSDPKPTETCIVLASTVNPSNPASTSYGGIYNGIYSGVKYYTYDSDTITTKLQNIEDEAVGGVAALFIAPTFLTANTDGVITQSKKFKAYSIDEENIKVPTSLNGYTPKNNKLLTYPYMYLLVTNASGGAAVYHYELFPDRKPWMGIMGVLTPGCSIRIAPIGYKNMGNELFDEGLNLGKYPQCNWATDHYTNWLTQNGTNVATGATSGISNMVMGAIGGGIAGSAWGGVGAVPGALIGGFLGGIGGLGQIFNSVQQVENADMVAPQVYGNINSGDVITSRGVNTFHFFAMTIKKEYAQIIDNFFSMYGYKINRVKTPNKNHRSNYWYTKTIDVNITGSIPMNDMNKIKACYNKGITFWKNADNIKNYSVSNSIV